MKSVRTATDRLPYVLQQNRFIFEALQDDAKRASLYAQLKANGFPALAFKSVLRHPGTGTWPSDDVYLLTSRSDINAALSQGSVAPYAGLDSGGKFMLGQDDPGAHGAQRKNAVAALRFSNRRITRCVREAVKRAMVLPHRLDEFDLVNDVAREAALRFVALVFGFPAKSHVLLQHAMWGTYTRLTFQIIGRHFVPDAGLPPSDSEATRKLRTDIEEQTRRAGEGRDFPEWWDKGVMKHSASGRIASMYGRASEDAKVIILGLMAGTVGNITSAVSNVIDHFFETDDGQGGKLIDGATDAARRGDLPVLKAMIDRAMRWRPAAPFLARTAREGLEVTGSRGSKLRVPKGAHLLLAMEADRPVDLDFIFGGADDQLFPHNCIGRHLAWPLVYETLRQVLVLPGLARVIDPATGRPKPLQKQWGAICTSLPLLHRRDRRFNQQPLFLMLPIKPPVAENALRLEILTRAGAPVVERALEDAKNVHFAWFGLNETRTHLTMYTVYDGDFDAYVEHFALKVPLFDEQFKFLDLAPPTPVRLHPKEFVDFIRQHNHKPLGDYFYSAYPRLGVADIHNRRLDGP